MVNKREIGAKNETVAVQYLLKKGYGILSRNFCIFGGELDVIARDEKGYLVFIEVRSRKNSLFGVPDDSVSFKKQNTLYETALQYLLENNLTNEDFRFDLICISGGGIRHYRAFM